VDAGGKEGCADLIDELVDLIENGAAMTGAGDGGPGADKAGDGAGAPEDAADEADVVVDGETTAGRAGGGSG
jgi:hypothetical protein